MMHGANSGVGCMLGIRTSNTSRWICYLLTLVMLQPWALMSVAHAAYSDDTAARLPVDNDDSYNFDIADVDGVNGPDVLATQVNIATAEGTTSDFSTNSSATGEVLYADDSVVCVEVTIDSETGYQVSGIIRARVR